MNPSIARCLAGVAALLATAAQANAPRPDPLDAAAKVPPASYRSAFQGYRPYADAEPAPWRESNELVGRIGGWRTYAKEAQQPEAPASAPAKPASPSTGHGGHTGQHKH